MAFARVVIATSLFFFSLIGVLYLIDLFIPHNYLDLNYIHRAAVYILFFISLGIPSFVMRLADKNTDFKELFFACIAFAGLMAAGSVYYDMNYQEFGQLFFTTLLLVVFSILFSLAGFFLAAKIRSKNRTN